MHARLKVPLLYVKLNPISHLVNVTLSTVLVSTLDPTDILGYAKFKGDKLAPSSFGQNCCGQTDQSDSSREKPDQSKLVCELHNGYCQYDWRHLISLSITDSCFTAHYSCLIQQILALLLLLK